VRFDGSVIGSQDAAAVTDASLNGETTTRLIRGVGRGAQAYVQLGHGGYETRGVNTGKIDIEAWGGVEFLAAPASERTPRTVTTAPIDAALNFGKNVWIILADLNPTIGTANNPYDVPDTYANIVSGTLRITLADGTVIGDLANNGVDDRVSGLFVL